jgi:hypothetical protein
MRDKYHPVAVTGKCGLATITGGNGIGINGPDAKIDVKGRVLCRAKTALIAMRRVCLSLRILEDFPTPCPEYSEGESIFKIQKVQIQWGLTNELICLLETSPRKTAGTGSETNYAPSPENHW